MSDNLFPKLFSSINQVPVIFTVGAVMASVVIYKTSSEKTEEQIKKNTNSPNSELEAKNLK